MEKITGICPGCRKKCDLATPRCHVGEAYAKTGMLPGGKKKDKKDHPGNDPMNTAENARRQDAASDDGRLADTLRAVSRAIRHGEGTLDALSAEEKAQLGALIEKAWAGMESACEDRHGHHRHHDHHDHCDHHDHNNHHEHCGHHGHGDEALCGCKGKHHHGH